MGNAALALAGGLVLGGGVRDMDHGVVGLQSFVQYPVNPSLRVEAGVAVGVTGVNDPTGETLVALTFASNPETTFRYPMQWDVFVHGAMADWTPVPTLRSGRLSGALHLRGGLEARFVALDVGTISEQYASTGKGDPMAREAEPEIETRLSPAVGVAFDAWFGKRFGLRWTGTERFALQEEPDYGNKLPNGDSAPLDKHKHLGTSLVWSLDFVAVL